MVINRNGFAMGDKVIIEVTNKLDLGSEVRAFVVFDSCDRKSFVEIDGKSALRFEASLYLITEREFGSKSKMSELCGAEHSGVSIGEALDSSRLPIRL